MKRQKKNSLLFLISLILIISCACVVYISLVLPIPRKNQNEISNNILGENLLRSSWGDNNIDTPYDMTIDDSGYLYITGTTWIQNEGYKCFLLKYDQTGNLIWDVFREDRIVDKAYSVTTDKLSNIYITGSDGFIAKYNNKGRLIWEFNWGGYSSDSKEIITDRSNNIYITGETSDFGGNNSEAFIVKFSPKGTLIWNKTFGDDFFDDGGESLSIDPSERYVYVTGYTFISASKKDMFLAKYDLNGNQEWLQKWGGNENEQANDLVIDQSGDIFCTGTTSSYGNGDSDMFLLKFNNLGLIEWNKTWGGLYSEHGNGIALDSCQNVYIIGTTNSFSSNDDAIVVKFSHSGNKIWNKTWGSSYIEKGIAIQINSLDFIYTTGTTNGFSDFYDDDVFFQKLNKEGDLIWSNPPGMIFNNLIVTMVVIITMGLIYGIVGYYILRNRRKPYEPKKIDSLTTEKPKIPEEVIKKNRILELKKELKNSNNIEQIRNLINRFEEENLDEFTELAKEKLFVIRKGKIKNTILDLGTKFPRLQIVEIAEKTGEEESLIIDVVKGMIENGEIYGEYFNSSKSVAFDQQANINEIDKLMESYEDWEKERVAKKD